MKKKNKGKVIPTPTECDIHLLIYGRECECLCNSLLEQNIYIYMCVKQHTNLVKCATNKQVLGTHMVIRIT